MRLHQWWLPQSRKRRINFFNNPDDLRYPGKRTVKYHEFVRGLGSHRQIQFGLQHRFIIFVIFRSLKTLTVWVYPKTIRLFLLNVRLLESAHAATIQAEFERILILKAI